MIHKLEQLAVKRPKTIWTYAFAVVATVITLAVRLSMHDVLRSRPTLIMFTVPIMLTAYLGGAGPGLLATALSYLFCSYFLLKPLGYFWVAAPVDRWQLFFVVLSGVFISILNEALHRARWRANIAGQGQRLADEALRDSEGRYRTLFEYAPDGIVIADANSVYLDANPSMCRMLGYSREELIGIHASKVVAPSELPHIGKALGVISQNSEYHREWEFRRKDGSAVFAEVVASKMPDGNLMALIRDSTERKQAEQALSNVDDALQKSEVQLQTIIENINEAVVVSDLEGHLLHFNHAALSMLGYTSADEGRRNFSNLIDTFELSALDGTPWTVNEWPITRVLRGENLYALEARMRRIGTEWEHVYSFGGTLAHDANGKPLMGVLTFSDITDRKRSEAQVRESEERFRTMANSMPQLAWIAQADGFIFWYNQPWFQYTGTTQEEMEGWGWQKVHHPEFLPSVMQQWGDAIKTGRPFEMEFPLRRADKSFRSFLTRVQPLKDSAGQVVQWFGTNTDVEALKQAEKEIHLLNNDLERRVAERTAQLQTVNKELETFSYSVSHDLRAPLRSIDGFSKAVLDDYKEKLDETGQDYLCRIRAASQRMGQLIDDMLNLARVSRSELRRGKTDLTQLAREVLEECRASSSDRSEVKLEIADGIVAHADSHLMRIVLANLLGNAWKFTSKNKDAKIVFGCEDNNGQREYFVRDNGVGFDMVYIGKLFGAFQRLHSSKDFPGTGIGLATVQRIIHRHGGRVRAESKPGEGTTFYFTVDQSASPKQTNPQDSIAMTADAA